MQKFTSVYARWQRRELSQTEAGELPGCSERQFRRYVESYAAGGLRGLRDGRLGRPSSNATPADVIAAQIADAMKKKGLTKTAMAAEMETTRAQLDRLLDPKDDSVTLGTLKRAAKALGKTLRLELA